MTVREVVRRLERTDDPWADMSGHGRSLGPLRDRVAALVQAGSDA